MIDIWMLFAMTIPFLEVVIHTTNELLKKRQPAPRGLVGVIKVSPNDNMEDETALKKDAAMRLTCRLLLPIISVIFTTTFWVAGFLKPYFSDENQDLNKSDCLSLDLI